MRWVCEDCGNVVPFRYRSEPAVIAGEDEPRDFDEMKCSECDEVKQGLIVPDCPNCSVARGSEYVRLQDTDWGRYCSRCSLHLVYTREMAGDRRKNGEPFCPACFERKGMGELDFHHWNYESDTGIHLCRECHTAVHDGKRVHQQDVESDGEPWQASALENLVKVHESNHPEIPERKVLLNVYNIPDYLGDLLPDK